jgi:hypothetical protein
MNFCERIEKLTEEEKDWIRKVMAFDCQVFEGDDQAIKVLSDMLGCNTAFLEDTDLDHWPGFQWTFEDGDLVLQDNGENFCFDELKLFVQSLIRKFRPKEVFSMTWAGTTSRVVTGGYGGGWLVVSKNKTSYEDTWATAEAKAGEHRKALEAQK